MSEKLSAFPEVPGDFNGYEGRPGMTLRDWFAGMAMQGLIANRGSSYWKDTPANAYAMADALLAERQKGGDA